MMAAKNYQEPFAHFLVALLLYLPTTALGWTEMYTLFVPIAFLFRHQVLERVKRFRKKPFHVRNRRTVWISVAYLTLIVINSLFSQQSIEDYVFGPAFLFPLTILAAFIVANPRVVNMLLIMIAVESLVACAQYLAGHSTFFPWLELYHTFDNYQSLYHTRVLGLSQNSSHLAEKALVGMLFLFFVRIRFKWLHPAALYPLFFATIVFTFGRTVMLVFLGALIVYILLSITRRDLSLVSRQKWILYLTCLNFVILVITNRFWIDQFKRSTPLPPPPSENVGEKLIHALKLEEMDLAGRQTIWAAAINFISDNLWFGNHSERFLVNSKHVHNSYLEALATHGVFIFSLLILLIVTNLRHANLLFIGCVALYSLGQFGILWDTSFLDIVFYSALFFVERIHDPNNREIPIRSDQGT